MMGDNYSGSRPNIVISPFFHRGVKLCNQSIQ